MRDKIRVTRDPIEFFGQNRFNILKIS